MFGYIEDDAHEEGQFFEEDDIVLASIFFEGGLDGVEGVVEEVRAHSSAEGGELGVGEGAAESLVCEAAAYVLVGEEGDGGEADDEDEEDNLPS